MFHEIFMCCSESSLLSDSFMNANVYKSIKNRAYVRWVELKKKSQFKQKYSQCV